MKKYSIINSGVAEILEGNDEKDVIAKFRKKHGEAKGAWHERLYEVNQVVHIGFIQSLIDEYRGMITETQEQIDELKKKQRTSNFPDMYHKRIQTAETQLQCYQQFITKLEGLL